MKKLMIAAAIVCAAVVSQAASISWTSNSKHLSDSAGNYISALDAGQTLVLVNLGDTLNWANAKEVEVGSGKATSSTVTITATPAAKVGLVTGTVAFEWESGAENYIDNNDYLALMVKNTKTGALSKLSYVGGDEVGNEAVYQVSGIASPGQSLTGKKIGFSGDFTAVPEPTSGLLLLLGVAGLALRRRRA